MLFEMTDCVKTISDENMYNPPPRLAELLSTVDTNSINVALEITPAIPPPVEFALLLWIKEL